MCRSGKPGFTQKLCAVGQLLELAVGFIEAGVGILPGLRGRDPFENGRQSG